MIASDAPWAARTAATWSGNLAVSVAAGRRRHQQGQQRRLVDEQRDLGFPEQGGGIPLSQQRGGLLALAEVGRAEVVEQLSGRMHDEHPPILPHPGACVPKDEAAVPPP